MNISSKNYKNTNETENGNQVPLMKAQININDEEFLKSLPESTRKLHIVAVAEGVTLTKLNPWKLQKSLNRIAGELENVDYIKSGALLATCRDMDQVKKWLKTKCIQFSEDLNIAISVTVALTGQSVQGKIYIPQNDDYENSIEDLLEQLRPQGVINIRKFYHDSEKSHIPLYVVTFFNEMLPKYIKVGYRRLTIDQYVPQPLKCIKCFQYGHHKNSCRNKTRCRRCGGLDHLTETCTQSAICPSCKGPHEAFNKECPTQIKEVKIAELKAKKKISYQDARDQIEKK